MDRLDDIIARNRRPHWSRSPVVRAIAIAVLVIVVLILVAFTDLAEPHVAPHPGPPATHADHVDGVLLRSAPPTDAGQRATAR